MYAVILKETNDQGEENFRIVSQHSTKTAAFAHFAELGGTANGYDIIDL